MHVAYNILIASEINEYKEATKNLTKTHRGVCKKIREQHRNILAAKKTKNKKHLLEQELKVIILV